VAVERLRILYIAHYFPPLGSSAALRSLKMVKYLADCGIDCIVLTTQPWGLRDPKDKELNREIPKGSIIHRYWTPEITWLYKALWGLKLHKLVEWISKNLMRPDNIILARPLVWRAAKRIMRTEPRPALAVISAGPFSLLTLGPKLKKKYRLPYICDWRDEWTNNPERINQNYPPRAQAREQAQEAVILAQASGIVYLTRLMRDNFHEVHPELRATAYRVIPNGYDEADFSGFQALDHKSGKLRILYTGSFYDRRQPDNLWRALRELIDEGAIDQKQIEIIIMGKNTRAFVFGAFMDDEQIQAIVKFLPYAPHRESIQHMQYADLLLIYIPSGANTQSILTGKIFEYLRTGKPILALAPLDGLAAEIVREAGTGFVADYADIEGIKTQILRLWTLWRDGKLGEIKADAEYVRQFDRKQQAGVLGGLIEEALG